jgi:hypothetical protein
MPDQIKMQLTVDATVATATYTDLTATNSASQNNNRNWLQIDNEDGVAFYWVASCAVAPPAFNTNMVKVAATTKHIVIDSKVPLGKVWVYHATGSNQSFKLWEG